MKRQLATLILFSVASIASANSNQAMPNEITLKGVTMKLIPAGEFIMGSNKEDTKGLQHEFCSIKPWYLDEHPKHKLKTDAYYIGEYEVTNKQYRDFVANTHRNPPTSWIESGYLVTLKEDKLKQLSEPQLRKVAVDRFHIDVDTRKMHKAQLINVIDKYFKSLDNMPVHNVSWYDAEAFCEWDGGAKLPSEIQWERASRGDNGNEFPWGNKFEPGLSNTGDEDWPMGTAPVGSYKKDRSAFGIYDLAGNVSEWVFDWYQPYPGSDYKSEQYGKKFKVIRGAGWGGSGHYALEMYQRGAYRLYLNPDTEDEDLGFRCSVDANTATKQMAKLTH